VPGMDPIGAVLIENSILLPLNDFKNSRGKLTPTEANSRVLRVRKCSVQVVISLQRDFVLCQLASHLLGFINIQQVVMSGISKHYC